MERCSYFIKDKALFGSFPTQSTVDYLEENGVRYFIDLTGNEEHKTVPYTTKYNYIKYPIMDHKIPKDWKSFAKLIIDICKYIRLLKEGEKIYIHCKGGHGRSGIVVACVLCYYYNISPENALRITAKCHANRPEMRDKWRRLGSPQGKKQKDFVRRFFRPLKYDNKIVSEYTSGLSNHSDHPVNIPNVGYFPTAHLAFQAFHDPNNPDYIKLLQNGIIILPDIQREWEEKKVDYMYKILSLKFEQNTAVQEQLVNTGLRPLIRISKDSFWGDGGNGQGKNVHGKLLAKIRDKLLN